MKKIIKSLFYIGTSLAFIGIVSKLGQWEYAPYLTVLGATLATLGQLNNPYKGNNLNIKRLVRKQFLASLFLIASGAAMMYLHNNEWVVCLMIAAILYLYTSFRIPAEEKKENKK